ncbi:MAG: hypothetical protein KIT45_05015 [Fimbriimonadia bacterium]|nr:hypothetical protein [Fimbriimonadia bacterium]
MYNRRNNIGARPNDQAFVERAHRAISAVGKWFNQRAIRSFLIFTVTGLLMLLTSSLVALMSKEVFETVLEDEMLATVIAIGMHVSLALAVHILISGIVEHRPLNRAAGATFTAISILGLIWIAITRAKLRIDNDDDAFRAIAYTIIYFVVEVVVPSVGGYLSALAHCEYIRRRSQSNTVGEIKQEVLNDNYHPDQTWASAAYQLENDIDVLTDSLTATSGDEHERLKKLREEKRFIHSRLISAHPTINNKEAMERYGVASDDQSSSSQVQENPAQNHRDIRWTRRNETDPQP